MYILLQKLTTFWSGKYTSRTLIITTALSLLVIVRVFFMEICLRPFKVLHISVRDTEEQFSNLSRDNLKRLLTHTASVFEYTEIGLIPGKRIYKGDNSLFNFNPHKIRDPIALIHDIRTASQTRNFIYDYDRYMKYISSGIQIEYGAKVGDKFNHLHVF